MNGIKRILNEHTENNMPKYIAAAAVFAAGFVLGIAGSFGSGNETVENVPEESMRQSFFGFPCGKI